jgi:hypothetical protein
MPSARLKNLAGTGSIAGGYKLSVFFEFAGKYRGVRVTGTNLRLTFWRTI